MGSVRAVGGVVRAAMASNPSIRLRCGGHSEGGAQRLGSGRQDAEVTLTSAVAGMPHGRGAERQQGVSNPVLSQVSGHIVFLRLILAFMEQLLAYESRVPVLLLDGIARWVQEAAYLATLDGTGVAADLVERLGTLSRAIFARDLSGASQTTGAPGALRTCQLLRGASALLNARRDGEQLTPAATLAAFMAFVVERAEPHGASDQRDFSSRCNRMPGVPARPYDGASLCTARQGGEGC
jgi:hypothetical protein